MQAPSVPNSPRAGRGRGPGQPLSIACCRPFTVVGWIAGLVLILTVFPNQFPALLCIFARSNPGSAEGKGQERVPTDRYRRICRRRVVHQPAESGGPVRCSARCCSARTTRLIDCPLAHTRSHTHVLWLPHLPPAHPHARKPDAAVCSPGYGHGSQPTGSRVYRPMPHTLLHPSRICPASFFPGPIRAHHRQSTKQVPVAQLCCTLCWPTGPPVSRHSLFFRPIRRFARKPCGRSEPTGPRSAMT